MSSPPWSADTDEVPTGRRTGQIIGGKYRLLRLIGQGGMGEVYEAQHAVVGRRFAVKFLHAHLAQSNSALLRFRREAEAAGALENEHIAAVVDFDISQDGAPFLVMEYLVGESLGELLQREGPLPLSRVVGALLQVCRGLQAAHGAGIIHRDLKPDNLFLCKRSDGSDFVKILDFGIAKLNRAEASDITRSGATLGTPFYMSPEQARGEKSIGERADVYALGVILYELLSAQKPHPGDSYNSILAHILSKPVVPLEQLRSGLPPGFAAVVERALSSLPEQRQASAAALASELAPFGGREVTAKQSHFELRAAVGGAATLPTPGAHTVPVRLESRALLRERHADEPVPVHAPESRSDEAAPRRPAVAALLLLALVGAFVGLWLLGRRAAIENRAPAAPAPKSAVPTPPSTSSSASAPAQASSALASSAPTSSAPTSSAPAPAPPPAARTPTAKPARPSTPAVPPPSASKPRVNFDEQNPY
ncbi:MAG TPA: serine/threonine-protein kinase [Polyangiaceae bacterium]|nr:serine/threonine-protein kinase [Polyangiaceae bacterium]